MSETSVFFTFDVMVQLKINWALTDAPQKVMHERYF